MKVWANIAFALVWTGIGVLIGYDAIHAHISFFGLFISATCIDIYREITK